MWRNGNQESLYIIFQIPEIRKSHLFLTALVFISRNTHYYNVSVSSFDYFIFRCVVRRIYTLVRIEINAFTIVVLIH